MSSLRHQSDNVESSPGTPSSLQTTEDASRKVAKTENRVSLQSMQDKIVDVEYIVPGVIPHMTIAVVIMYNGFAVVGKTAPADVENYDKGLGERFAYEDAVRQLWQLEGYALRCRLSDEGEDRA